MTEASSQISLCLHVQLSNSELTSAFFGNCDLKCISSCRYVPSFIPPGLAAVVNSGKEIEKKVLADEILDQF